MSLTIAYLHLYFTEDEQNILCKYKQMEEATLISGIINFKIKIDCITKGFNIKC